MDHSEITVNTCVVVREIQPPIYYNGLLNHRRDFGGFRHISFDEGRFTASRFDLLYGFRAAFGIDVSDYDAGSLLRKSNRCRAPDAGTTASNECDFAFKLFSHNCHSFYSFASTPVLT